MSQINIISWKVDNNQISHIFMSSIESSQFQIFKYKESNSRSNRKSVLPNSSTWNCKFESHLPSICSCLKNRILNNLVALVSKSANCESDNCKNLNNFWKFLSNICDRVHEGESESLENSISDCTLQWVDFEELNIDVSQVLSYVSGYLVRRLKFSDEYYSKYIKLIYFIHNKTSITCTRFLRNIQKKIH